MRVTYDSAADMAYVHLCDIAPDGVERTHALVLETAGDPCFINLDFGPSGELLGFEVMGARGALPADLLRDASAPSG